MKIPDRILNMLASRTDADRMENDIFMFIDVGILIRKKQMEDGKIEDTLIRLLTSKGRMQYYVSSGIKWRTGREESKHPTAVSLHCIKKE